MKKIICFFLVLNFIACQEKNNGHFDILKETNVEVKNNLSQRRLVGVYEANKLHGGLLLYIEENYALLIDQGLHQELNYAYIGTLKQNKDTLNFIVKYSFDRLSYLKTSSKRLTHSDDWIQFSAPNLKIQNKNKILYQFLPIIKGEDTLLLEYQMHEKTLEFKKLHNNLD